MRVALLISAALAASGCSSPGRDVRVGAVPGDFALELRIAPTEGREGALYIVEADRSMRAAVGSGVSEQFYPPRTRVLTLPEMQRVYNLLAETGVLERKARSADQPAGPPLSLYVSAGGRRAAIPIGAGEAVDLDPLVRELDRLAWVRP